MALFERPVGGTLMVAALLLAAYMIGRHAVAFRRSGGTKERENIGREQPDGRSEEHTSELQSLMRISNAVFCLKKKNKISRIGEKRTNSNNVGQRNTRYCSI